MPGSAPAPAPAPARSRPLPLGGWLEREQVSEVVAGSAAAGVSRKTAFTSVGGKVEALKLAIDSAQAEAADVLWLFNDPAVYRRLVTEQGWAAGRYQRWLRRRPGQHAYR